MAGSTEQEGLIQWERQQVRFSCIKTNRWFAAATRCITAACRIHTLSCFRFSAQRRTRPSNGAGCHGAADAHWQRCKTAGYGREEKRKEGSVRGDGYCGYLAQTCAFRITVLRRRRMERRADTQFAANRRLVSAFFLTNNIKN